MAVTIELPAHGECIETHRERWKEILADPLLSRHPGRVETDRYGHIIMLPPAAAEHGGSQADLVSLLTKHLPSGRVMVECPIITSDGVKVADVVWISRERWRQVRGEVCLPQAPEICIEVISPGNSSREMAEKRALYFEAGAREVWLLKADGMIVFHVGTRQAPATMSDLCPDFPKSLSPSD